jgi:hypothetical protein
MQEGKENNEEEELENDVAIKTLSEQQSKIESCEEYRIFSNKYRGPKYAHG